MCTYVTATTAIAGSGLGREDWFGLSQGVVYFDHPQSAPFEHALCLDFWGSDPPGPPRRVAVELDARSARALAEQILAVLQSEEVRALESDEGDEKAN